jgi:gamma-glutamyltranspeptidase/glutathione hydrolase
LRRIVITLVVALIVGFLCSCGVARLAPPDGASRAEGAGEETTSSEALESGKSTVEDTASAEGPYVEPSESTSTSPAVGGSGMVSSANPLATRAGLEILNEGGNAFDAAVAVAAALNVVEPMMSGIGGYGAIVVYDAQRGETRFLNAGSRTPAALDPAVFRSPTPDFEENRCGIKAVSTPGNLNAWETLSDDYGELGWRRLFDPAIELARGGYVLDGITAGWIDAAWSKFPENARSIYGNNGKPLKSGEVLVQDDLARTFGLIAEQGAGAMYGGELGGVIDAAMREDGGFLTLDDLRNNRAEWQDTVSIDHKGYEVVTATPPATSWGTLLRLGMMDRFDLQAQAHNSSAYLHLFAEVSKQAGQASRGYTTGPEVAETPLDFLLSEEFITEQVAQVNPSWASASAPFGQPASPRCTPQSYTSPYPTSTPSTPEVQNAQEGHTTHFVVADEGGNVVSATQTLGNIFGSKTMPEGTGIWLNDAIAWLRFEPPGSSAPGSAFNLAPDRQSLYALCPVLVMSDGRPVGAIGTPGGRTIQQTTPQMLMNVLDFGMDIQQTVAAPRTSTTSPNAVLVENGIPRSVRNELSALGHEVRLDERGLGNAHGLTIEYGAEGRPIRFTGGADPRGIGVAAGFSRK